MFYFGTPICWYFNIQCVFTTYKLELQKMRKNKPNVIVNLSFGSPIGEGFLHYRLIIIQMMLDGDVCFVALK